MAQQSLFQYLALSAVLLVMTQFQLTRHTGVDRALQSAVTLPEFLRASQHDKAREEHKPLNILILYPDDWRYDSIGGMAPVVRTPFLNRLASQGIHFTHNCVTTSICWISRATLFTGQYAARHQSYRLKDTNFMDNWNTSWPALLQRHANYYVGHVGKWQFGGRPNFDYAHFHEGRHWYQEKGRQVHATDYTKDRAIDFLRTRPKDQPFAVTVAFFPPKAVSDDAKPGAQWSPKNETMSLYENESIPEPIDMYNGRQMLPVVMQEETIGRNRFLTRFNHSEKFQVSMKNYYRLITDVDVACEKIVDELVAQGIENETLVIFTTDNGYMLGEHGLGGKWYPYEESIRVPLIIRDPRMSTSKKDTKDDSFTLNIDLAKTILGAAGVKQVPERMQGRDIADLYLPPTTKGIWRNEFYYEYPNRGGKRFPASSALVRKEWKYMNWLDLDEYEQLFHLSEDPKEQHDVKEAFPEVLDEMRKRHDELKREVV